MNKESRAKGKGVKIRSKICQVKKCSTYTRQGKTLSLFFEVISSSCSPRHVGLFLNGPVPWPHERCSGTMSKPSHYIEPWHQFSGWVTGAGLLRDLSLLWEDGPRHLCHLTTPCGTSAQRKRRVVRTLPRPLQKAKSLMSHFIPLWYVEAWSMSYCSCKIHNSEW